MTNIERIKNMSVEELADLLIADGVYEDVDYDWDENPISRVEPCYYTPVGEFYYETHDEVKEAVIDWLVEDCDET